MTIKNEIYWHRKIIWKQKNIFLISHSFKSPIFPKSCTLFINVFLRLLIISQDTISLWKQTPKCRNTRKTPIKATMYSTSLILFANKKSIYLNFHQPHESFFIHQKVKSKIIITISIKYQQKLNFHTFINQQFITPCHNSIKFIFPHWTLTCFILS